MAELIRPWDVYVKNKKLGTLQDAEYELDAPGTIENAAEGSVGRTQAPVVSKVTCNMVTTFAGRTATKALKQALLGNVPVTLTLGPEEGQILTFKDCWCHNYKGKADFKNGSCTGAFSFEATRPTITG
jgi:hypothetical protein